MTQRKSEHYLALAGIPGAVMYFLHVILGTLAYPGYSNLSMAVSDLTALDAPSFAVASRFTALYGALSCLAVTMVFLLARGRFSPAFRRGIALYAAMNWVSFIGYTLFPLSGSGYRGTIQDIVHLYAVTVAVVVLSIVSLVMIFIGGHRDAIARWVAIVALVALCFMMAGPIGTGLAPRAYFGVFERFSGFSAVVFTAALSVFGFSLE